MKKEMDKIVLYGNHYQEFRIQFWDYFTIPLLQKFTEICNKGGFGTIVSFQGCGIERMGGEYVFSWKKDQKLTIKAGEVDLDSGYIILKGKIDFFTVNRIRNFPLFHLRGLYKKRLSRRWKYEN